MKKQKNTLVVAVAIAICFILSSCGIMKNNDFSSRKYTHFKKGESAIAVNTVKADKKINNEPITAKLIENNSEIKNTDNNNQVNETTTASTYQISNNKTSNLKEQNNFFKSKVVRKEKVQRLSNFVMKHLINKPNTASFERGGGHSFLMLFIVVLLVLILLGMLGVLGFIAGVLLYVLWIVLLVLLIMWLLGMMH